MRAIEHDEAGVAETKGRDVTDHLINFCFRYPVGVLTLVLIVVAVGLWLCVVRGIDERN